MRCVFAAAGGVDDHFAFMLSTVQASHCLPPPPCQACDLLAWLAKDALSPPGVSSPPFDLASVLYKDLNKPAGASRVLQRYRRQPRHVGENPRRNRPCRSVVPCLSRTHATRACGGAAISMRITAAVLFAFFAVPSIRTCFCVAGLALALRRHFLSLGSRLCACLTVFLATTSCHAGARHDETHDGPLAEIRGDCHAES